MSDALPATIHLKVVTPRRLLAEADVEAVFLPALEGQIGVYPGHRPLFLGIGKGTLTYREAGSEESLRIADHGGRARKIGARRKRPRNGKRRREPGGFSKVPGGPGTFSSLEQRRNCH